MSGLKQTKSAASTQNSERNVSSSCISVHAFMLILAVKKNGDLYGKLTISDATYNQQDEVFTTTVAVSAVVSCPESPTPPPPPQGSSTSNIQRDSFISVARSEIDNG